MHGADSHSNGKGDEDQQSSLTPLLSSLGLLEAAPDEAEVERAEGASSLG